MPSATPVARGQKTRARRPSVRGQRLPPPDDVSTLLVRRCRAAPSSWRAPRGGPHSAFPVSSASMIIFSSQTICQAISLAVRDFGSGGNWSLPESGQSRCASSSIRLPRTWRTGLFRPCGLPSRNHNGARGRFRVFFKPAALTPAAGRVATLPRPLSCRSSVASPPSNV